MFQRTLSHNLSAAFATMQAALLAIAYRGNPVLILGEIDKISDQVKTDKGMSLPGAFEVLKSMIEPSTARHWTCPYYRVPFNLSAVNRVMTTNSTAYLPAAFRDRCKIVELRRPTTTELLEVAECRIAQEFPHDLQGSAKPLIAGVGATCAQAQAHVGAPVGSDPR